MATHTIDRLVDANGDEFVFSNNAIRVEDANLAIPPLGDGDSVGSTGDFFISSGSGKNLPNTVDNFDIHTTVTHYTSTTYRLSQIATPTSSSNPAGIYERGASSFDGVTWTFGNWTKDCQVAFSAVVKSENTSNGCTLKFTAIDGSIKSVTVRNVVNAGNADTVDGYHIVLGSPNGAAKTIFLA